MKYTPEESKKAKEKYKVPEIVFIPEVKIIFDGYYIVESKMNYL